MTVDPLPTLAEWEKPDRHKWGERVTILPSESPDGCERSERTREGMRAQIEHTPPCVWVRR